MKKFCLSLLILFSSGFCYSQGIDYALKFDGIDDYVDCGDPSNGSLDFDVNQSFSIVVWARTNAFPNDKYLALVNKRETQSLVHYEGYTLAINQFGKVYWSVEDTLANYSQVNGNVIVNDVEWHMITATRDVQTDSIYIYIDGSLDTSVLDNLQAGLQSKVNFWIGRWIDYNRHFIGRIDEVSVWSKALKTADMIDLMTCPPDTSDADLISYWPMNEGKGSMVYDSASQSNDGSISGASWDTTAYRYSCVSSVATLYAIEELSIFPNPASTFLKIEGDLNGALVGYQILSIQGNTIQEGVLTDNEIALKNEWKKGMYVLKLNVNQSIYSFRFLKE